MALSRIQINAGKPSKALSHFNYIMGQGKYAKKTPEITHTQNGNMPDWAKDDPSLFWQSSDEYERKNGSPYREHVLSLPRELNQEQRLELVNDWIRYSLKDEHAYSFAIHETMATDGKVQPHCHLMFCDRVNDNINRPAPRFFKRYNKKNPEKGGARKANTGMNNTQRQEQILQIRSDFGELLKWHLREHGFDNEAQNVDMRNWKERGLDEQPHNIPMPAFQLKKRMQQELDEMEKYKERELKKIKPKPEPTPAPVLDDEWDEPAPEPTPSYKPPTPFDTPPSPYAPPSPFKR